MSPTDMRPEALVSDPRQVALRHWLSTLDPGLELDVDSLQPASSDASFRRYFRLNGQAGSGVSFIAMDAPPEREPVAPFMAIAAFLAGARVSVPEIYAASTAQGFLLLSDLGRATYLDELAPNTADQLYRDASQALLRVQALAPADFLGNYDRALLLREMELFPEWYVERHRDHRVSAEERTALSSIFDDLARCALAQPQVVVHRDYHARNLMALEEAGLAGTIGGSRGRADFGNPGILDFQDAVVGPVTYDLVSLFRDAYIAWDEEQILDWTVRYWEAARTQGLPVNPDFGDFWRDFEWMGLQRHLKILGIFARLHHRDGKDGYLQNLPLVMRYTRGVASRYRNFFPLIRLLDRIEAVAQRSGFSF